MATKKTAKKKKKGAKAKATKIHDADVWTKGQWIVKSGELRRGKGNPGADNLLTVVGEKIPYDALDALKADLDKRKLTRQGVYLAHDSMGCPRYAGRGDIFGRLRKHKDAHPDELTYFSFYVVAEKKHEREVETLLIRGAGFLLEFNDRKKRVGIKPGDIKDFEAGTSFYERQKKKGKKK